jgi:predicted ATPase
VPHRPHHIIESVAITGGYLRDLRIDLAPGLNCIIGGTGAGKTTLLELILFALGAPVSEARAEAHADLVREALPTGRVTVKVRTRHGIVYESSRACGEPPRVTNAAGELVDVELAGEIFEVEYHATKEIERIATDPVAQVALLDRLVEPELRPVVADITRLLRQLDENAAELARLGREVDDDAERAAQVPMLVEALRGLQVPSGLDPAAAKQAFEDKQRRVRERAALTYQGELLDQRRKLVDALARERTCFAPRLEPDLERGANADVFATLAGELRSVDRQDADAVGRLAAGLDAARAAVARATHALAARHAVADDGYQAVVAREAVDRSALAERARLEQRLADASAVAKRQEARRREVATLRDTRGRMLADLARHRDTQLTLRERAVREINEALSGRVRISLRPGEDREAYAKLLTELTAGANIRPASFLRTLARDLRPEELCAAVEADDVEPLVAVDPSKTNRVERARHVLATLRASGRVFELETVSFEDVPLVELSTDHGYQPASKLSSGERCAAVLPIVLLRSRGPLIIDEPEQHLHNRYIYSVLVKMMAEAELGGQLIFATHNANIVALGDAKRVFAMEGAAGQGRVAEFGTVDELESAIVILEGGKEALLRRAKSYGATAGNGEA